MNKSLLQISKLLPDRLYLQLMFKYHMKSWINLKDPRTFNEKLQWLKLYNRQPVFTVMVDKVDAKTFVANQIGEEHIIPTLGVWKNPDDIDFDALPKQFVLKCAHNSGLGMCICKDKELLDYKAVREGLRKGLKSDYYKYT